MPPSDPRNLRAKWQRALEERRKAGAVAPPVDVTPRAPSRAESPSDTGKSSTAPAERAATTTAPKAAPPKTPAPETPPPKRVVAAPDEDESTEPTSKKQGATAKTDGDGSEGAPKKVAASTSTWSSIAAALVLVGGVGLALRTFVSADSPPPEEPREDPLFTSSAPASSGTSVALAPEEKPPIPDRCTPATRDPFVVGDAPAPEPSAQAPMGDDSPDDQLAPFAVELGRGVRFGTGFAVGSQRQAEGGTVSMVATLGADGGEGKLVRLARSRGDFDPPIVAAAGSVILAAMMEPNAGGRAIRIAKVEGDRVTWGPELSENNDESFAVDIQASGSRALVVWDDVPLGRERSVIDLATFDVATMRGSGGRAITPPSIDADTPRLITRPGGFWLSYLVHGVAKTAPTAENEGDEEDPKAPPKKPEKKPVRNDDDSDTEAAGEAIAHQWIELLPLDENGMSTGAARAVTPKDSRVIGYDLGPGEDGRAVLIYREDDTPSGSHGGRVKVIVAELGGIGDPQVIAEDGVGAGVPQLFGGWVVIHSLSGPVQLGAIGPRGELTGELAPERSLKHGEILAADGETFLVATPAGRAMKLSVARCAR